MKNSDKLIARAIQCAKAGDFARAEKIALTVLEGDPTNFDALHIYGNARLERNDLRSATSLLIEVVALDPNFPPAQMNLANCLALSGKHADALHHFDAAIKLRPNYTEATYNRALSLKELGRADDAIKSLRDAASSSSDCEPRVYTLLCELLVEAGQLDDARVTLESGLRNLPKSAELMFCLGCVLVRQKNETRAAEFFSQARRLGPSDALAHRRRAEALTAVNRLEGALEDYFRAIACEPSDPKLYTARAKIFESLGKDAESRLDKDAAYAGHVRNGYLRSSCGNLNSALKDLSAALELKPEDPKALNTRADIYHDMADYHAALIDFEAARRLEGADLTRLALICNLKCRTVDWTGLVEMQEEVRRKGLEEVGLVPFHIISLIDDPALHHQIARTRIGDHNRLKIRPFMVSVPGRKIRIGYFSADLCQHPVLQLIRGVFSNHDRERFHVSAFSLTKKKDASYHQIKTVFDTFHNVENAKDEEITALARKEKIDIAIDLTGFTNEARFGIFAPKAAPVQANFLGYPGTMGADFMDYIIADPIVIPQQLREHYSEKVAYLPCFWPDDSLRPQHRPNERRSDHNLPETGFVFCCFNDTYKILPERFDLWMRILKQVEGSILWLRTRDPQTESNFARQAAARGLDPGRIFFAGLTSYDQHISRHQFVDVFLDTGPYNAHTTSADALWAGVPVLTRIGGSFASRVAASLVTRAGVPELVTTSDDDYVNLGVRLAKEPGLLEGIKGKIDAARVESPLFDVTRFTRELEQLYEEMMRRHHAGLPPDHIILPGA